MGKLVAECWRVVLRRPALGIGIAVAAFIQIGYRLSVPYFFQQVFDQGIANRNATILYRSIAGLAVMLALFGLAILLQERAASDLSMDVANRLRRKLFAKLLAMPEHIIAQHRPASLVDRMGNDAGLVETAIVRGLPTLFIQGVLVVTSVVLLFLIEWRLALVVLVSLPLTIVAAKPFSRRASHARRQLGEIRSRMLGLTAEAAACHAILRLFFIHEGKHSA